MRPQPQRAGNLATLRCCINGTAKRAFLSDGDNIYIVGEGDTLLGKFRVTKIGNANLDFEEIASGRHGSTQLTEEPVAAPAS